MTYFFDEHLDDVNYFKKYTYNTPLFISAQKESEFKIIQKLLYRCITYFVTNYNEFDYLMPIEPKLRDIYDLISDVTYEVGTYRTDFVISQDNQIKLIEITCRFALNSYIRSGLFCKIADDQIKAVNTQLSNVYLEDYIRFISDFEKLISDKKQIYVIGGSAKDEGKFLQKFGETHGYEIIIMTIEEMIFRIDELENVTVIPQLSQKEWCDLPDECIKKLHSNHILNDVRTVIFAHDKRFFDVLNNKMFLSKVLSSEEIALFSQFLVPTYQKNTHSENWNDAIQNKDEFIIKPTNLGKGEGVFYGKLVSEDIWKQLLNDNCQSTIIQPYVSQRKFNGFVDEELRSDDFFVGTLLFFNDNYYGPGLVRASSHPVTNQGDDRKVAVCKIDEELLKQEIFSESMIL